jgi:hypothetical protein
MVRAWAPSLGWLVPASPSAELQALLKPVALDLAIMKRSVEQLASNQDQLARKQDQMAQAFATLQAAEQDINQNILALAPLAPKAGHVPPLKPSQSPAQKPGRFNRQARANRCLMLGYERTSPARARMSPFDAVDGARSAASKCQRVVA